ncbi:MAG: D-Ala-D-Ala carboxypeptidase family metallohydrolase [Pyrinomonadaceae bacterium MAG19_C2-C3]|nr:D-Ala-D-Ala carboxypeptidase family metallohydrolase [Pyrinomonadaceae bacterium MAG19_C2-C3]
MSEVDKSNIQVPRLTAHFSLAEMVASETAARQNIRNEPSATVIRNLELLCVSILEPARAAVGALHINSGYRSPALNAAVGGSPTSAHKFGCAADVVPLKVRKMDFARWVKANCDFDQIILEFGGMVKSPVVGSKTVIYEPAWIHAGIRAGNKNNRRQVLRIMSGTGYQSFSL